MNPWQAGRNLHMKQLKAVIIGCGNIAGGYDSKEPLTEKAIRTHAQAYSLNPHVELIGAYDTDEKVGRQFCEFWKTPHFFGSISALMKECGPDIVSICSPNDTHYGIFNMVLNHKPKAIICEKPLAMTASHAQEMSTNAKKQNVILAVNYMRRWDVELSNLFKRIESGEFGKFQGGRVLYTKGVYHNASHAINLFQKWLGNMTAVKIHKVLEEAQMDDLLAHFHLSFEKCEDIYFQAIDHKFYNYFEIDLLMTKARLFMPYGGSKIEIQWNNEVIKGSLNVAIGEVISNVVQCVLNKTPLKMESSEAVRTVEICDEIRKAATECLN